MMMLMMMIFNNFFLQSFVFYEKMWKNILGPGRSQMTIWHTCIPCWIHETSNTRSEYVIFITFPLQQWLHERA